MSKTDSKILMVASVKQRNWVAKNDRNRAQVMRDRTRYQRRAKHPQRSQENQ